MKTQRTKDKGFGTGCSGSGDKVKQNRPGNAHTGRAKVKLRTSGR